ncbi:hypothetical protein LPJ55_005447 [Coemansia sp. RSA 990]|nr:hypothetical protein LPJ55_005447 [Coemansia sp. RSA 990]KAJ2649066.1 hypothetical protein IWW40_003477 [Coemansia sp. RSA 1250]KAJ2671725.1 hypothetical protein IWW42_003184 [Coemansia sp. RSA 1085]
MDSQQTVDKRVRLILRFPYKRPEDFVQPQVQPADPFSVEEQVWRCLLSLPGPDRPQDILAELEQDQVTFDWELLAETLKVPLAEVFEAASSLFYKHMGRPLELGEQGIQLTPAPPLAVEQLLESTDNGSSSDNAQPQQRAQMTESIIVKEPAENESGSTSSHSLDHPANSRDFTGLRSVESLGNGEQAEAPGSPAVELSIATPNNNHGSQQLDSQSVEVEQPTELLAQEQSDVMRESMLADAMGSRFLPSTQVARGPQTRVQQMQRHIQKQHKQEQRVSSASSSFSDLSSSSLTESAMQDALISEGMNASTAMSSLLGSRMFPWSKKRR